MGTGLLRAYEAGMKRRLLQTHVRLLTDTCKTLKNTSNNFYKYRPAYEAGMKRKLSSSSPPTLSSPASAFLTPASPALPQKRQKQPPKMILGVEAQDIPFITQSFNRHRLLALPFSNSLSINHCHQLHCIHVL